MSKLDLFGDFYFWPLLAFFRGRTKTFLPKLIQHLLVECFEVLIKGFQPAWNNFKPSNSY